MAITNSKVFPKQLDKSIDKMFYGYYLDHPGEYTSIAVDAGYEGGGELKEAELSGLGALAQIREGQTVSFDEPVEGNEMTTTPVKYGLGFQITEEMALYDVHGKMKKMNFATKELARSAVVKYDTEFFDLFNNGFATHTAKDGNYIFLNGTHTTIKSGTAQNNRPSTDASMSETSLQAAREYFIGLTDQSGRPATCEMDKLLYPKELLSTVEVILDTKYKVGSMDNDINTVQKMGLNPVMSRYLTSSSAWFVLSDQHDFGWSWIRKGRLETADDFHTGNALCKFTVIFLKRCYNYEFAYGTTG